MTNREENLPSNNNDEEEEKHDNSVHYNKELMQYRLLIQQPLIQHNLHEVYKVTDIQFKEIHGILPIEKNENGIALAGKGTIWVD